MKTFNDLTKEEKVVLTVEQVQYYARIDCANRGVIIPQKPINNLIEVAPPTAKFYQVGYESFVFETPEDAQNYIDAKNKALGIKGVANSYDDKNRYITKRDADYKDFKSIVLYTQEEATELKSILGHNAETMKELKEYEEALSKYNSIEQDIWDEIQEISYRNLRVAYYDKVYSDYLELASGNDEIAFTFFDKAYRNISLSDIDREIVDEMLNEPEIVECNE